jgi:hypothetical protein
LFPEKVLQGFEEIYVPDVTVPFYFYEPAKGLGGIFVCAT